MAVHATPLMFHNDNPSDWFDINQMNPPPPPQLQMMPPATATGFPSHSLAALFEQQIQEMDNYVIQESKRMRAAIAVQERKHLVSMLRIIKMNTEIHLRLKDEELAIAQQTNLQLEGCLKNTEEERDAWQRLATENEAIVYTLRRTLEQLHVEEEQEASSSNFVGGDSVPDLWLPCRLCVARESCMVLLPCRHLCMCQTCEDLVEACPVCSSIKRGSTEVFFD